MKWLYYLEACIIITLLCYSAVAEVPDTSAGPISDELWLSVFGPMAESGVISTDLKETELAGDDTDGLYLLYSLIFIRDSFGKITEGYQYVGLQQADNLTRVTDEIPLMVQTYKTATQDLSISQDLAPLKEKMTLVTDSFAQVNEAFKKMALYTQKGVDEQNVAAFEVDYAILTKKDTTYEEAVSEALTTLGSVGLNPYFTKWSDIINK
jgi:hypothetical protein